MEQKINIAELLEDCPKGMELYSPIFGKLKFNEVNAINNRILVVQQNDCIAEFESDGRLINCKNGECLLFPSKGKTTWEGFVPPYEFKDGDICYIKTDVFEHIFIFKVNEDPNLIKKYVNLSETYFYTDKSPICNINAVKEIRLATEEEKTKLFDAIKANGYKWNSETKTLEKFFEPKFKVGDKVVKKDTNEDVVLITDIADNYYTVETKYGMEVAISISIQNEYELVPNKFDITTLKPFDKVLVRDTNTQKWTADVFSFFDKTHVYPYVCVGHYTNQCIPYFGNEHLLGTTNDCDEYFKNW